VRRGWGEEERLEKDAAGPTVFENRSVPACTSHRIAGAFTSEA